MIYTAAGTGVSKSILLSLPLVLMWWLCIEIPSNAEAMLVAEKVVKDREFGPTPDFSGKSTARFRAPQRWEKRLFDVPLLEQTPRKYDLEWKHGPNFSLKNPGMLPGIELGFEMHSFQALETVIPEGGLPEDLHVNRDRLPLLTPPSINGPDYNGGFLRFTW